jgi:hypothetical protein
MYLKDLVLDSGNETDDTGRIYLDDEEDEEDI